MLVKECLLCVFVHWPKQKKFLEPLVIGSDTSKKLWLCRPQAEVMPGSHGQLICPYYEVKIFLWLFKFLDLDPFLVSYLEDMLVVSVQITEQRLQTKIGNIIGCFHRRTTTFVIRVGAAVHFSFSSQYARRVYRKYSDQKRFCFIFWPRSPDIVFTIVYSEAERQRLEQQINKIRFKLF